MAELAQALASAREVLALFGTDVLQKTIWGSPMGKTHLARRIVAEIPEHRVYVEPFAGGGKILFTKDPSEVEVVADLDPEIAFAFKFTKAITAAQLDRLRRKKWVGDKDHFKRLEQSVVPDDDVERFYRFAYLSRFSFDKLRRGTCAKVLEELANEETVSARLSVFEQSDTATFTGFRRVDLVDGGAR